LKLNFNVRLEAPLDAPAKPELNLSIDIPEKYARIGLESIQLVTAIKQGIDRIKETLDEHADNNSNKMP